uniref:Uncharacterized protein n=1 Tax=Timema tahoe TaxID=61484 RepID=A0A7R9IAF2_9NEOP|nr:unnamed protein product [Timema tahoe]
MAARGGPVNLHYFFRANICPTLLSRTDMDLIEVLWKQDVDLGFSLDLFTPPKSPMLDEKPDKEHEPQDELEKLKALQASAAATEAAEKRRTNIMEVMSLWPAFPRR